MEKSILTGHISIHTYGSQWWSDIVLFWDSTAYHFVLHHLALRTDSQDQDFPAQIKFSTDFVRGVVYATPDLHNSKTPQTAHAKNSATSASKYSEWNSSHSILLLHSDLSSPRPFLRWNIREIDYPAHLAPFSPSPLFCMLLCLFTQYCKP